MMKTALRISGACLAISLILTVVAGVMTVREKRLDAAAAQDFLRLHVRAASDSEKDQDIKLKVRDTVLAFTTELFADVPDKASAMAKMEENAPLLEALCEACVRENGGDEDVSVCVAREAFDYREYDGFFLPAGEYDAVVVNIGEGEGHNWWCVVFPAVCLSASYGDVRTDIQKVPARLRLSTTVRTGPVHCDLWIKRVFKAIFAK